MDAKPRKPYPARAFTVHTLETRLDRMWKDFSNPFAGLMGI